MVLSWMKVMTIHLITFSELKGVQECNFKQLPYYHNIFSDWQIAKSKIWT